MSTLLHSGASDNRGKQIAAKSSNLTRPARPGTSQHATPKQLRCQQWSILTKATDGGQTTGGNVLVGPAHSS